MATKTTVGDRVKLTKDDLVGVVRFVGEIKGKKGIFYGIELDDAKGKNNGSVDKVKYFKCAAKKGLFVAKTGIAKTNPKANKDAPRVEVGDTVQCKAAKCKGKVRYIGTPYGVKDLGIFYGVELEKPNGKNNGTANGREFFKCKAKCGSFVQAAGFTVVGGAAAKKAGGKKKEKAADKPKDEPKEEEKKDEDYKEGDRVVVKPDKVGQIRWIGTDKDWPEGTWYGIRLTEDRGDCDGEWKEKRKFYCPEGFAVFTELRNIESRADDDSFDFMQEDEQYQKELAEKAAVYKKESDKLQTLQDKFKEVDKDNSGMIDRAEFNELASNELGCTKRETNALFREIDVNRSGSISFAEFDAWVKKLGGVQELNKLADGGDDDAKAEPAAGDAEEQAPADAEKPQDDADASAADDTAAAAPKDEPAAPKDEPAEEAAQDEPQSEAVADAPQDDAEPAQADAEPAQADAEPAADAGDAAGDDAAAENNANEENADQAADNDAAGDEAAADDKAADDKPADDKPVDE